MSFSSLRLAIAAAAGASFLVLAGPAGATGQAEASSKIAPQTESGGPAKDQKLICKRFDRTGTRMNSIRACYTKEQWKKIEDEQD